MPVVCATVTFSTLLTNLALKFVRFFHGVLQTQRNMPVLLRFGHQFVLNRATQTNISLKRKFTL